MAATAVWRIRPSGSNTNGGGYDAGIAGAGTDYSQQDAAQASGSHGTATGTTAFSDTIAAAFTSAMVGNALWIASGAGFTTGAYFVTGFTDSSNITLDRSPGTGTVAAWKLGGGWGGAANDSLTANIKTTGNVVGGNIVYILGAGIPNPAAYSFDYTITATITPAQGSVGVNLVHYMGDPATPNFSTGGMPCISTAEMFATNAITHIDRLWFVASAANASHKIIDAGRYHSNVVCDQNGYDIGYSAAGACLNVEVFSSHAVRTTQAQYAITCDHTGPPIIFCNIHDTVGPGIFGEDQPRIYYTIIAKCGGDGIIFSDDASHGVYHAVIQNCTIDANTGHGININMAGGDAGALQDARIFNNLITNHVGAGKKGISVSSGTVAANDVLKTFIDYNGFQGNTTDLGGISYGPHDTIYGSSPYTAQSTEDYTLA